MDSGTLCIVSSKDDGFKSDIEGQLVIFLYAEPAPRKFARGRLTRKRVRIVGPRGDQWLFEDRLEQVSL